MNPMLRLVVQRMEALSRRVGDLSIEVHNIAHAEKTEREDILIQLSTIVGLLAELQTSLDGIREEMSALSTSPRVYVAPKDAPRPSRPDDPHATPPQPPQPKGITP